MSSMVRNIQKRNLKRLGKYEPKSQLTYFNNDDQGYKTLHPTRGWQTVSGKRVAAQMKMMQKYGFVR